MEENNSKNIPGSDSAAEPRLREGLLIRLQEKYGDLEFTARDWLLLGLCLLPAGLLCLGAPLMGGWLSQLRIPLIYLLCLLLSVTAVGRRRHISPAPVFLIVCDLALILLSVFHRNAFISGVNCLAIPALTSLAMLSLSGVNPRSPFSFRAARTAVNHALRSLFEHIPVPVYQLTRRRIAGSVSFGAVLISLLLCIPILVVILALLADADVVFAFCLSGILTAQPATLPWRILLTLVAALMLFSWLLSLRLPGHEAPETKIPKIPAVFPSILLPLLNIVYALFVYVQLMMFVGVTNSAAMTGSYSEYARTGFFQLVAVTVINLMLLGASLSASRGRWIRGMSGLLIAATGVILVSAFWRMRLYISVYGLTTLRVMTLWGMLAIAALLVIAAIALATERIRAFSVGFICLIVLWVGLNAVDVDRVIGDYNTTHYGSEEESDWSLTLEDTRGEQAENSEYTSVICQIDCEESIYGIHLEYFLDRQPQGGMSIVNASTDSPLAQGERLHAQFEERDFPSPEALGEQTFGIMAFVVLENGSELPVDCFWEWNAECGSEYLFMLSGNSRDGFTLAPAESETDYTASTPRVGRPWSHPSKS